MATKGKAPAKRAGDKRGTPKGKATRPGGRGGRIGNPKFKPTETHRELVLSHAAVGTPHPIIAEEIKNADGQSIGLATLYRHFRKELDEGLPRANARLGGVLYKGALTGDNKKLEMWFDRRGGADWQKRSGLELSGPGGQPIRTEEMSLPTDFSKLPKEKRRQLEQLLLEAERGSGDEPA